MSDNMKTSEPSRQISLFETESDESMSSRAGSRARTSALRESEREWAKEQGLAYGQKLPVWLANYDHDTSSWRTSQISLADQANGQEDGLEEFSGTWPRSGMMRNGTAYQLPTLEPGIGGTEYGRLPTPTKTADAKGAPKNRYFGSPTCRSNLREVLRDGPDDPIFPHPDFVDRVMGYPIGHSALEPEEIL